MLAILVCAPIFWFLTSVSVLPQLSAELSCNCYHLSVLRRPFLSSAGPPGLSGAPLGSQLNPLCTIWGYKLHGVHVQYVPGCPKQICRWLWSDCYCFVSKGCTAPCIFLVFVGWEDSLNVFVSIGHSSTSNELRIIIHVCYINESGMHVMLENTSRKCKSNFKDVGIAAQ